jgi:hypothetical protein
MAKKKTAEKTTVKETSAPLGLSGARARLSVDDPASVFLGSFSTLGFPEPDQDWRTLNLDDQTFDRAAPSEILERLADLSPEVSRAIWDFLRFCNAGWEVDVKRPGTQTTDDRAKAVVEAFFGRLGDLYGSADVVINRLFLAAFLRGSFFAELVFDANGREAVDVATPDPVTVRFEKRSDPVRGQVWVPFQWQGGKRAYLDSELVRYVPVDPLPGKPYGRAMATPAIFTCLFAIGLLRDLRRVVAQQGYPRLDIELDTEMLWKWAQKLGKDADPVKLKNFAEEQFEKVRTEYALLQPDDAFVHSNTSKVNRPVGTLGTEALGAVEGLMRSIERSMVRALKSSPYMFGMSESTTETQSNRQAEAMYAGIRAIQHLAEGMFEYFGRLILQAQGIVGEVQFRFAEVRAAEEMRDEMVTELKIRNALSRYFAGWIDQNAAAEQGADVEEPAEEEPLYVPQGYVAAGEGEAAEPQPLGTQPGEEGDEAEEQERRRKRKPRGKRDPFTPSGADDDLPAVDAAEWEVEEVDVERAVGVWDQTLPAWNGMLEAELVGGE